MRTYMNLPTRCRPLQHITDSSQCCIRTQLFQASLTRQAAPHVNRAARGVKHHQCALGSSDLERNSCWDNFGGITLNPSKRPSILANFSAASTRNYPTTRRSHNLHSLCRHNKKSAAFPDLSSRASPASNLQPPSFRRGLILRLLTLQRCWPESSSAATTTFAYSQRHYSKQSCRLQRRASKLGNQIRPITTQKRTFSTGQQLSAHLANDLMSSDTKPEPDTSSPEPAQHKPLVVGLKKPTNSNNNNMSSTDATQALNEQIQQNVTTNTASAAPAEGKANTKKKEKAPKQPKPPKPAPVVAPTSPALIDLRVGHILRAIQHPNADTLYVSTIDMGDAEGTEHTQKDEETGKIVRTVCSGLRAYIPLEQMQDRKIVVVANLKPVNMRSIKSAAMVLAASPRQEEGADPHAPDRTVELVVPPSTSQAGDKVYFEGWPYGDGKGPEKQLNPKKKQWEAIQPGFYTSDDLKVGFDAGVCEEVAGSEKGTLIVEGKGPCTVPTLKGAVVR